MSVPATLPSGTPIVEDRRWRRLSGAGVCTRQPRRQAEKENAAPEPREGAAFEDWRLTEPTARSSGLLLVLRCAVLDNPWAIVLRLPGGRCLLDDGDLHEFTPFLVEWPIRVYETDAAVRCARLTTADLERTLVTRRVVHVTKLGVRRHGAAAAAHGNERAIAALFLERAQTLEALGRGVPPGFVAAVDVPGRLRACRR